MKELSFEQMEKVNGGDYTGHDVSCAVTNIVVLTGLIFAPTGLGLVLAAASVAGAAAGGCYTPKW